MTDEIICPFYGQDEDWCDVGCGYISPSDVRQIIRHCRAHHHDCRKFQELAVRYPERVAASSPLPAPVRSVAVMRDGLAGAPAALDPSGEKPPTSPPEPGRAAGPHGGAVLSLAATTANPAPLGLFGLGMTVMLFGLQQTGHFALDPLVSAVGLFYGGLAQIVGGILAWKRNHVFAATAFTSYGLFWLTLVGLMVFPRAGIGQAPSSLAMVSYLILWGLFSGVMFFAALPLGRIIAAVFVCLAAFFLLLSLGEALIVPALHHGAGWVGVGCGLLAGYLGFAQVLNDVYGRRIFPC